MTELEAIIGTCIWNLKETHKVELKYQEYPNGEKSLWILVDGKRVFIVSTMNGNREMLEKQMVRELIMAGIAKGHEMMKEKIQVV